MKVLIINVVCGTKSTGRICADLLTEFEKQGHEVKIAYGRDIVPENLKEKSVRIGNNFDIKFHGLKGRIFDRCGFGSKSATKKFLNWVSSYEPDLIWLHNLHGYYINVKLLFEWIKKHPNTKIRWTLHDCWAFTGHCCYFTMADCSKWKVQCNNCPEQHSYPCSLLFDQSKKNYIQKKKIFTGVQDLTIITPSYWLSDLVKQSFLKEYPIEVHYNTIDKDLFKPTESNFKEKYGLREKMIVLGVAAVWDKRKGLDDFIKLSRMLDDTYRIVLVGLTKQQIRTLPNNITGIQKITDSKELAKIYSAADIFVNPSKEETFGMTTIEAESCGTPAIVYKNTACEEIVNKMGGIAVKQSVDALYSAITNKEYVSNNGMNF